LGAQRDTISSSIVMMSRRVMSLPYLQNRDTASFLQGYKGRFLAQERFGRFSVALEVVVGEVRHKGLYRTLPVT